MIINNNISIHNEYIVHSIVLNIRIENRSKE